MPDEIAYIALAVSIGSAVYQGVAQSSAADEQKKYLTEKLKQEGIVTEAEKKLREAQFNLVEKELFQPAAPAPKPADTGQPFAIDPRLLIGAAVVLGAVALSRR